MSKILIIAAASILLIYSRAFATSLPPQMVYDIQWGNLSLAKSQLQLLPDKQNLQILASFSLSQCLIVSLARDFIFSFGAIERAYLYELK